MPIDCACAPLYPILPPSEKLSTGSSLPTAAGMLGAVLGGVHSTAPSTHLLVQVPRSPGMHALRETLLLSACEALGPRLRIVSNR